MNYKINDDDNVYFLNCNKIMMNIEGLLRLGRIENILTCTTCEKQRLDEFARERIIANYLLIFSASDTGPESWHIRTTNPHTLRSHQFFAPNIFKKMQEAFVGRLKIQHSFFVHDIVHRSTGKLQYCASRII